VSPTGATLNAQVNPGNGATGVIFEYGFGGGFEATREIGEPVPGDGVPHSVSVTLSALTPGTTYSFRSVASNFAGPTVGETVSFSTPDAPAVGAESVTAVTATTANVGASVKAGFDPTSYRFEYGTSPGYGSVAGTGGLSGSDDDEHGVTTALSNLTPGTSYHFRVTASNGFGTTAGQDQTFTTPTVPKSTLEPPKCPKRHVRRHGKCVPMKKHKRPKQGSHKHG
jgi:phosphodiesterase/alkaline phosphatase D-like protein